MNSEILYKTIDTLLEKETDTINRIKKELEKEMKLRFPDMNLRFITKDWTEMLIIRSGPKPIDVGRVDPVIRQMNFAINLFVMEYDLIPEAIKSLKKE